jgi:hypothetical protein
MTTPPFIGPLFPGVSPFIGPMRQSAGVVPRPIQPQAMVGVRSDRQ